MPGSATRAAIADGLTTLQNAAAATGNGDQISVKGWDGIAVQVTGTFTATITFEGTLDGSTWVSLQAYNVATGAVSTTSTAAADYLIAVAGFEYFRTRVTWSSGTSVTTKVRAFPGSVAAALAGTGATTQPVSLAANPSYSTIATGEVQGNTGATQNPSVACKEVTIKTLRDNAGAVYIGISGVTKADGTTDTSTGVQLGPGEAITLPISNLNLTYRICDNAGDDFTYIALT